jgi:hypothetical protein
LLQLHLSLHGDLLSFLLPPFLLLPFPLREIFWNPGERLFRKIIKNSLNIQGGQRDKEDGERGITEEGKGREESRKRGERGRNEGETREGNKGGTREE